MTYVLDAMTTKQIDPVVSDEARKLKALFENHQARLKTENIKVSQQSFGKEVGWTQAAVGNYLSGRNALNTNAATIFANFLNCSIKDFSPRLYETIMKQASSSDVVGSKNLNIQEIPVYDFGGLEMIFGSNNEGNVMPEPIKKEILTGELPGGLIGFIQPDESMQIENKGEVFIIDPNRQAKPGNLVLVRTGIEQYELRKIKIIEINETSEPVIFELVPTHSDFPKRTVDVRNSNIQICGVAIKQIKNLT